MRLIRLAVPPLATILALASTAPVAVAVAPAPTPLLARAEKRIRTVAPALIEIRRDLHRHPEVSGAERRTARVVATRLRALGLEVRTGVGGHGVVATLRGGRPGPRVAIRADMDAVADDAPDPVAFRSLTPGLRHVCGHEVHTTVALGVAEALAPLRADLTGTVVFVFQPAEERADGARAMLADGAFADGRPHAIYAFHCAPLEVGTIGTKPGTMLAPRGAIPGVTNDAALEARARVVVRATLGDSALVVSRTVPPGFSEDYGAFQAVAPGIMLWLGVSNAARGTAGQPHAPDFVADEGAIAVGARVMCALVLDALSRGR